MVSKQAVTLRVPIDESWDAGASLQVFCDFGSGTIDTSKPLLRRPREVFAGQRAARGVGLQPVGIGRTGDFKASRPRGGLGRTRVGVTPLGTTPPFIDVTVDVPPAFGVWKFAAQVLDRDGNPQSGPLQEISAVVSGTQPAALKSFSLFGYDAGADQVIFDFTTDAE